MGEKTKNIVVVGAGFGGLLTALKLNKKFADHPGYRIILIDEKSYQTYTPSLYEVATAYRGGQLHKGDEKVFAQAVAGSVSFPIRDLIQGTKITFLQDRVVDIQRDVKAVITEHNDAVQYEYCVVAAGAQTAYNNVEGAEAHCSSFRTLGDALRIRRQVTRLFERASQENRDITIITIGAGLSGFEITAEMARYAKHLANGVFGVPREKVHFQLIEAADTVLPGMPAAMQRRARKRLKELGVEVITSSRIASIAPHRVIVGGDQQHHGDLLIWSGGVRGSELLETIQGAELHTSGRIFTDAYLRVDGADDIFIVGDSAHFTDQKKERVVPATAWAAEQMAPIAAENIYRAAFNKPFVGYRPKYPGFIAAAGGKYAIAHLYGFTFSGFCAWVVKRLVDLKYIVSIYPFFTGLTIWLKELDLFSRND